jgi:hypothetical protein
MRSHRRNTAAGPIRGASKVKGQTGGRTNKRLSPERASEIQAGPLCRHWSGGTSSRASLRRRRRRRRQQQHTRAYVGPPSVCPRRHLPPQLNVVDSAGSQIAPGWSARRRLEKPSGTRMQGSVNESPSSACLLPAVCHLVFVRSSVSSNSCVGDSLPAQNRLNDVRTIRRDRYRLVAANISTALGERHLSIIFFSGGCSSNCAHARWRGDAEVV